MRGGVNNRPGNMAPVHLYAGFELIGFHAVLLTFVWLYNGRLSRNFRDVARFARKHRGYGT